MTPTSAPPSTPEGTEAVLVEGGTAALIDLLSAPLITTAVIALVTYMVPTVRWARTLRNDLTVYASLPDGPEREYWKERVEQQSERLRLYRTLVPAWDRGFGWAAVILFILALFFLVTEGLPSSLHPTDVTFMILGGATGIWVTISTLRGRSFMGFKSADYPRYIESERQFYASAERRRRIAKRVRKVRRLRATEARKARASTDSTLGTNAPTNDIQT